MGCAGTFVPVSATSGTAAYAPADGSSGGWILSFRITQSLLSTCTASGACAPVAPAAAAAATAAACASLSASLTAGCWSNFQMSPVPGQSGAMGSSLLTAGFFFDCGAWIIDAASLTLCAFTLASAARAAPESGRLLARWALPGGLFFSLAALVFRCIALACNLTNERRQWMPAQQPFTDDDYGGAGLLPPYPLAGQGTPGVINFGIRPQPVGMLLGATTWAYGAAPGAALLFTAIASSALQVAAYLLAVAAVRAHVAAGDARRAAEAARRDEEEAEKAAAFL